MAVQVGSLLDISKTDAAATPEGGESRASVVRLGGEPLLGLGGTQKGDGETGGALLDTAEALPARVELAPWQAAAKTESNTRSSKASAALARARVEKVLNLKVLSSESEAVHTDAQSTGTAVSDGVDLSVLDAIRVVLLHSEVRSDGNGHSYLVGLNDTHIGTGEQLGAVCALDVPNIAALSCLTAEGGAAAGPLTEASANVATVDPALEAVSALDPVAAFTASASAGAGEAVEDAAPVAAPPVVAAAESSRSADAPATATATSGPAALPRTGAALAGLSTSALTALALGAALRRFGRRSVTA
ncbi:MAG TPA: hypothetical protein VFS16_08895 [Acidimicrobiia bacterium]|nr:hypothetical protein [Acidimicrobiia bacterium]